MVYEEKETGNKFKTRDVIIRNCFFGFMGLVVVFGMFRFQALLSEEPDKALLVANFSDMHMQSSYSHYKPEWASLDSRPLPEWYDKAKVGVMVTWGLFSVSGFIGNESYWKNHLNATYKNSSEFDGMRKIYPPGFCYPKLAKKFTTSLYDSESWAKLFKDSGIRYVILTAKHHDGYTLFESQRSVRWCMKNNGPMNEILANLVHTIRQNYKIQFGIYYSLNEWFNQWYLQDRASGFRSRDYIYRKLWPEIKQLMYMYRPFVLWTGGDREAPSKYWDTLNIRSWLYNEGPTRAQIVVNDNWGLDSRCQHGDFYVCNERYTPDVLQSHKWEKVINMDRLSKSYRPDMRCDDVISTKEILQTLAKTVSCGGNMLINIGATSEGIIPLIFQDRLLDFGQWLRRNGNSIYGTSPYRSQNDSVTKNVWYTCKRVKYNETAPTAKPQESDSLIAIFAIFFDWPEDNILRLGDIAPDYKNITSAKLLGFSGTLNMTKTIEGEVKIMLPNITSSLDIYMAWVIEFKKWRDIAEELEEERLLREEKRREIIEKMSKAPIGNAENHTLEREVIL